MFPGRGRGRRVNLEITYEFLNGKFTGLNLTFEPRDYEQIIASYTAKLGPRHRVQREIVRTHSGGTCRNETSTWQTNSGRLHVSRYGPSVDCGAAVIYSPAALREKARRRIEAAEKAKDEL